MLFQHCFVIMHHLTLFSSVSSDPEAYMVMLSNTVPSFLTMLFSVPQWKSLHQINIWFCGCLVIVTLSSLFQCISHGGRSRTLAFNRNMINFPEIVCRDEQLLYLRLSVVDVNSERMLPNLGIPNMQYIRYIVGKSSAMIILFCAPCTCSSCFNLLTPCV
jgi:hypothetical protein